MKITIINELGKNGQRYNNLILTFTLNGLEQNVRIKPVFERDYINLVEMATTGKEDK